MAAPEGWEIPDSVQIMAEKKLKEGRQIDICIRSESPHKRVIGIEVKTTEDSAEADQLNQYLDDMKSMSEFLGCDIQMVYLTPFNRERVGNKADLLPTIRIFDKFSKECLGTKHLSWLDVAEIPWEDNELWKQHQGYVRNYISSHEDMERWLSDRSEAKRGFTEFFGEERTECFQRRLEEIGIPLGVDGTNIDLSEINQPPSQFAELIVGALACLLGSDSVLALNDSEKDDEFPAELRRQFLESPYREVHAALFSLSEQYSSVWIKGERDYGVRVAHRRHPGGVSLLRSHGSTRLGIQKLFI